MMLSSRALAELTAGLVEVPAEITVRDVTLDSRTVSPGCLFLACGGRTHHGVAFAEDAAARGARAILYESDGRTAPPALPAGIFVRGVPQLHRHASAIAARFFDEPSHSLTIAGITGTNGKTTCA